MGKSKISGIVLLLLWLWNSSVSQPVLSDCPVLTDVRAELVRVAESQIGVREKTGKNDGTEVEKYLRVVNLDKGYAWCAALMAWTHEEVGVPNPKSAWSPSWVNKNVVHRKNEKRITPFKSQKGQVFGLYYESLKRVGHVGMITGENKLHFITVEGNTSGHGVREGDGVYGKIRKKELVHVVSDHVGKYIEEEGRQ